MWPIDSVWADLRLQRVRFLSSDVRLANANCASQKRLYLQRQEKRLGLSTISTDRLRFNCLTS